MKIKKLQIDWCFCPIKLRGLGPNKLSWVYMRYLPARVKWLFQNHNFLMFKSYCITSIRFHKISWIFENQTRALQLESVRAWLLPTDKKFSANLSMFLTCFSSNDSMTRIYVFHRDHSSSLLSQFHVNRGVPCMESDV